LILHKVSQLIRSGDVSAARSLVDDTLLRFRAVSSVPEVGLIEKHMGEALYLQAVCYLRSDPAKSAVALADALMRSSDHAFKNVSMFVLEIRSALCTHAIPHLEALVAAGNSLAPLALTFLRVAIDTDSSTASTSEIVAGMMAAAAAAATKDRAYMAYQLIRTTESASPEERIPVLRSAIAVGIIAAEIDLAQILITGSAAEQAEAVALCSAPHHATDPAARFLVAQARLNGTGTPLDAAAAATELESLASRGVTEAMALLGRCYQLGQGVKQCLQTASRWYRAVSRTGGYDAALMALAIDSHVAQTRARKPKSKHSSSQAVHPDALAVCADLCSQCYFDRETASRAAAAGDPLGCALYALYLLAAEPSEAAAEARSLLQVAAQGGVRDAAFALGCLHLKDGASADAIPLLRTAAAAGLVEAQTVLGTLLLEQSPSQRYEAVAWLRRAGQAGDTEAMTALGMRLLCEGNTGGAASWLRDAAVANGDAALALDYLQRSRSN
jgi:TPR repeat protein